MSKIPTITEEQLRTTLYKIYYCEFMDKKLSAYIKQKDKYHWDNHSFDDFKYRLSNYETIFTCEKLETPCNKCWVCDAFHKLYPVDPEDYRIALIQELLDLMTVHSRKISIQNGKDFWYPTYTWFTYEKNKRLISLIDKPLPVKIHDSEEGYETVITINPYKYDNIHQWGELRPKDDIFGQYEMTIRTNKDIYFKWISETTYGEWDE